MFHIQKKLISPKWCAEICLPGCWQAFLLCQDSPSTWQVWNIKKIKQHDHYTSTPCAGDNKRPLFAVFLSHKTMLYMFQVLRKRAIDLLTTWMSTRAVGREFNVNFSTISSLQRHLREFGIAPKFGIAPRIWSNQPHNRRLHATSLAQDLHIWLLHLRDRLRPATQTADETGDFHNRRSSAQTQKPFQGSSSVCSSSSPRSWPDCSLES